jgi:hypothetical protein
MDMRLAVVSGPPLQAEKLSALPEEPGVQAVLAAESSHGGAGRKVYHRARPAWEPGRRPSCNHSRALRHSGGTHPDLLEERPVPRVAAVVLAGTLAALAPTAGAQDSLASRAGRRPLLPVAEEIALARSAAPPGVSARARVLALTDTGYVVVDSGAGEPATRVTCVVSRSWPRSVEPHCYDAEGAATVLPIQLRRDVLRHRGRPEAEIDAEIARGLASGRFRLPARPALTYMMSAAQVLYDDAGRRVGAWRPHLMLYYPYLQGAALGLGPTPDMRVGVVSQPGTPLANLTVVVPGFVEPAPPARAASP